MMKANLGLANKDIERILELSADAHIRRRGTVKDSPEFHNLTGAIAAYGKALALLAALQRLEEFYAMFGMRARLFCSVFVEGKADPICGKKIVPFAGSRWQRKIPRRWFLALAESTFGRASRSDCFHRPYGRNQNPSCLRLRLSSILKRRHPWTFCGRPSPGYLF